MLRDITIGQHYPGNSILHRCDPRLKLAAAVGYIVVLFVASNPVGLLLALALLAALYALGRIPLRLLGKSLKPILPIILFTLVINLFMTTAQGEQPLFHWWILTVYPRGVRYAVLIAGRVVALIGGTSLLTYTTSPIVLMDALESVLRPFSDGLWAVTNALCAVPETLLRPIKRVRLPLRLRLPVHELAMMMTIALRMIPLLIEETEKIMNAQKARGAMLDNGTLVQRVRALVPILVPLFLSAFRRADELATAMECRCYRGGEGRTRLKVLRFTRSDALCAAVITLLLACIAATRWFVPGL